MTEGLREDAEARSETKGGKKRLAWTEVATAKDGCPAGPSPATHHVKVLCGREKGHGALADLGLSPDSTKHCCVSDDLLCLSVP